MSNTPKIRFDGFTDDWEQRKLGDIVTVYDGVHQTPNYQTSGVMFLSVENIATLKSNKFISFEDFKRDYKVYPQRNDILMTRIGDVGTTNVVTDNDVKAYYVSLALLKYKETNPFFLSSAIQSDFVQKGLSNRTLKTAIPMKINKDEIGQVDVMLPTSADEQDKIGSFFSQLDSLITLHQRKCATLQKFKKSMLQKMFPQNGESVPEIRFNGFTDSWEQRKWSETVSISTEMVDPRSGLYDDFPHVAPGNIESFTGRVFDNVKTVKEEELISGKFRFRKGDIIYGKINPQLGKYAFAQYDGLTSADAYVLNAYNGVDQKYLFTVLQTKDFYDYSVSVSRRSGMPKINRNELNAYSFTAPNEEEQSKIGEFFLSIDYLITLHQRKLETLQKMKKALLQKMFV